MAEKKIIWEAKGDFPFKFYIEKALVVDKNTGKLIVTGIASTTNVDHDNERMSKEAIYSMANIINESGVPLRIQHNLADNAVVGKVYKATVDERNQLKIDAELDPGHPVVPFVYQSLKDGMKMGFSVGGKVKSAIKEFVESKGKAVKTFYNIELQEVSLTPKPSNFDAWCVAKSIVKAGESADYFLDGPFYTEYLHENQQLDYIQSFAKSIPSAEWKKVDITKDNKEETMTDEKDETTKAAEDTEETKTKASETEETKEKAASDKEDETATKFVSAKKFNEFTSLVSKALEGLTKAMENRPLDQANPDKSKEEEEYQQTAKMDTDAKDAVNPDKKKEDNEVSAKSRDGQTDPGPEANGSDLGGTREKSSSSSTAKKADTEEDTYAMETTKSLMKSLERIEALKAKRVKKAEEDEETTKAADETETEMTKSQIHPVDRLAKNVADILEAMDQKFEKSEGNGFRIIGHKQAFIDALRSDEEFQAEIRKAMGTAGAKKSVSFGVPYTQDRSGKRYSLVPVGQEEATVKKSKKDVKDFKTFYKSEFSTLND